MGYKVDAELIEYIYAAAGENSEYVLEVPELATACA